MSAGQMIVDHTKIGAAFRRLSLPVAIQILGDQLLGAVDTIAIGSLGTVALAGATAANTVFVAIAFTSFGFMSGTSIVAAQRIGAGDVEGFASTVRAGALVPVLLGVLCFGASLYASSPVIHALIGALPSAPASAVYLTLRCASIIPIVISGTLIVGLGAAGNQRLGILVLAVVNLVHIPLLMLLGLGWWTHHPFGIVGAGISSLLSETIAAIIAIVYVARRPLQLRTLVAAGATLRATRFAGGDLPAGRHGARYLHRRDARAAGSDGGRGISRAQRRLRSHVRRAESLTERDADRDRPAAWRARS
jgi:Na+-driven multidrug efflux pump